MKKQRLLKAMREVGTIMGGMTFVASAIYGMAFLTMKYLGALAMVVSLLVGCFIGLTALFYAMESGNETPKT